MAPPALHASLAVVTSRILNVKKMTPDLPLSPVPVFPLPQVVVGGVVEEPSLRPPGPGRSGLLTRPHQAVALKGTVF